MDSHKHVDWGIVSVQWNDLNQSLLVLLANTLNYKRAVPNQKISSISTSNGHFFVWDENSLCKMSLGLVFTTEIFLLNSRRVVLECWYARLPREKQYSFFTVRGNFLRVTRVELYPMLILELLSILELE
jgi:hypothetical protein